MFKKLTIILLILTVLPTWAERNYKLPPMDTATLKQQPLNYSGPLKYAEATAIKDIYIKNHKTLNGEWQTLSDGQQQYDLRISSKNATSLNVGMRDFFLPPSAELWVSNDDSSILRGPFTDRYNPQNGYFWIGDVPGDHVNLRITVSPQEKQYLSFEVTQVSRGFYAYWKTTSENTLKSGSCNIDVACPEGDGWRPEISSVGQYNFQSSSGSYICSGQLINNTSQNGKPYFLTASHCGYTDSSKSERDSIAASVNITWNYESKTCRAPGSTASGSPINKGTFNQRQAGATYISSNADSDFSLLLLNQAPNPQYNVQYTGWDRSDTAFIGAVGIHHPSGHAKRISLDYDPLRIIGLGSDLITYPGNTHLQVVSWNLGTTEQGSSGSGLWNNDYHLNTSGRCDAPLVKIIPPNSAQVGSLTTFSAHVTGGSGNYQYAWDINGDGQIDGTGSTITSRYHQSYVGNAVLTVKDNSGCEGRDSRAVIVESANIQLQGKPQLTQVCGNNDGTIDPGERWRATFQLKNIGSQTANNSYAMFGKNRDQAASEGSDNHGNKYTICEKQFIDINQNTNKKPWVKAPQWDNYTADDMGSVKVQLKKPFDHYGESISSLVASTNGYLSTNPSAEGVDYSNDCPIPAVPDFDTGGRISPLHADLQGSEFYHKYFATCPREAESGAVACEIFTWKGADFVDSSTKENTDFQAILYPETSQWVFQYDDSSVRTALATIGIQNQAGDDALLVGCNQSGLVQTNQALCIYNKQRGIPTKDADEFDLVSPAISLGNLAVNQSRELQVEFTIDADAFCGQNYGIDYQAGVYDQGFNQGQANIIQFQVAEGSQCQKVTYCGIENNNTIKPENGLWWNPARSGNGVDMHIFNDNRLLYTMYTGLPNRTPVWYTADGDDSAFNQYYSQIAHVSSPGGYQPGNQNITLAGWSNTTFLTTKKAIQVREINGHLSAEKLALDEIDNTGYTSNNHTGHYFAPNEPGWGQSVITRGQKRIIINYIYDLAGNPYWTIASGYNDNSKLTAAYADTFCPHCPSVPFEAKAVGEIQMQFNGNTNGIINLYDINDPANNSQPGAKWKRSQLPVINLIPQPK